MSGTEELALHTADGCVLDAQLARPAPGAARPAAAVLCHPHPRFGGTMRSIVISALFEELPAMGHPTLRFDFRGVGRSSGEHSGGRDEPLDVVAALDGLRERVGDVPVVLAGWSFGADVALSVGDPRVGGWVAIAPPLRFAGDLAAVAADPRPKHVVLAGHDEFRPADEVAVAVAPWANTTVEVVARASHFFVGRTDRVVDATARFLARY